MALNPGKFYTRRTFDGSHTILKKEQSNSNTVLCFQKLLHSLLLLLLVCVLRKWVL